MVYVVRSVLKTEVIELRNVEMGTDCLFCACAVSSRKVKERKEEKACAGRLVSAPLAVRLQAVGMHALTHIPPAPVTFRQYHIQAMARFSRDSRSKP